MRVGPSRFSEAVAVIDRARREGLTRIMVVGADGTFTTAISTAFRQATAQAGLASLTPVVYPAGTSDLMDTARLVAKARPEVVFIAEPTARAGVVVRYLAAAGVVTRGATGRVRAEGEVRFVQLAAPAEWRDGAVSKEDERYLQGVWVAVEWDPNRGQGAAAFDAEARRRLGRGATVLEAVGLDAVVLARSVLAGGAEATRKAFVERLSSGMTVSGSALGGVRLDTGREPVRTARLLRLRGGQFEPVPPRP